ncbi:MAG TPA: TPM domain-containing protein, partial [Chitinophagaceae bacterium]|nr:TPM domain-containing protein [Chitinophagaceae bacterium]
MFNLFRKKNKFFTDEEHHAFVKAIRHAEKMTSGEIRLYIESKCKKTDPLTRAARIFYKLKMQKTEHRNGVLIYVATTDKKLAI